MELLETQDPEKKRLIETSHRHRQEMTRELTEISERTEKVLKNALIIGGALAITYLVVSQLSSKTKKKRVKKESENSPQNQQEKPKASPGILAKVGDKMLNAATVLLVDMAKEKLSGYLQHRKPNNENS